MTSQYIYLTSSKIVYSFLSHHSVLLILYALILEAYAFGKDQFGVALLTKNEALSLSVKRAIIVKCIDIQIPIP